MSANALENSDLTSCLFPSNWDKHKRTAIQRESSEASAGNPAATNMTPCSQLSADETSSVQSSLQQSIDEMRQSQEGHQFKIQVIMEQVLQVLSPTASPKHSIWIFVKLQMASLRQELRQELQSLKACMESRKVPEPEITSELPKASGHPRMPHDSFLHDDDLSFQSFIQKELQDVKSSVISEVQASKVESLANVEIMGLNEDDHSFQSFIRKELQDVKSSVISEVEASKVECLANLESIRKVLEQRSNHDDNQEWQLPKVGTVASLTEHAQEALWTELEDAVEEMDMEHHLYLPIIARYLDQRSVWHHIFSHFNCASLLYAELPSSALARATEHPLFIMFQTVLILANATIMGYEADAGIKAALQEPKEAVPEWLDACNVVFTIVFALELIFRISALRSWFFVAPYEWGWNLFDVFVVGMSVIVDFVLTGVKLSFIRTFRIARALRAARVIRILRFFRELRRMLFAMIASVSSLMWFFLFLTMILFMFSILLLQGLVFALDDMPYDSQGQANLQNSDEQQGYASKRAKIKEWYGSMDSSMFTLVCAVTGGADWTILREPLVDAGHLYTFAFLIYILFVTVGIVNVLTGIFVHCSADVVDNSLIIMNEQIKVDSFVKQLMEIFGELDVSGTGKIAWPTFKEAMKDSWLQAFLSSHDLEPTHARLIFDLLDVHNTGTIDITEFVMGILRLKGEAKAIDARSIQRQVSLLPKLLNGNS